MIRTLMLLVTLALVCGAAPDGGDPKPPKSKPKAVAKADPALRKALARDRKTNNRRYLHLLGVGATHPVKDPLLGWHGRQYPDPVLAGTPAGEAQKRNLDRGRKAFAALVKATGTVEGRVHNRWLRRHPGILWLAGGGDRAWQVPTLRPILEHIQMEINPTLLPVLRGGTVDFINRDKCRDNIMARCATASFSLWFTGPDQMQSKAFPKAGPVPLLCKVHPDEWGTVVVTPTPFFALTDRKGRFEIVHVPPGAWKLHFWHPKLKPVSVAVQVEAGARLERTFKKLKRS